MSMGLPAARMRTTRNLSQADAAFDGTLLKQTSLLASLITARREARSGPLLGHAELMRLVKSQQALLSAACEPACDRMAA